MSEHAGVVPSGPLGAAAALPSEGLTAFRRVPAPGGRA
jgi:hypothetical protein